MKAPALVVLATCLLLPLCHAQDFADPQAQVAATPKPVTPATGPDTTCGNNRCEKPHLITGENCGNCPADCGPCQDRDEVYECEEEKKFALAFDDGPSPGVAQNLLQLLAARDIKASFFTVGQRVNSNPALLRAEEDGGHSLLSHTYNHVNLREQTSEDIVQELYKTEVEHKAAGVCSLPTLFRPPYGAIGSRVRRITSAMGYRAVMWNLDAEDWKNAENNPNQVKQEFRDQLDNLNPTGIITLQHDLFQYTVDLVPFVIQQVENRGYKFVSVERCLWGPDFRKHPSWVHARRGCGKSKVDWPMPSASDACPVSDWSVWSDCSASCDKGTRTRVRLTTPPTLAATSAACADTELIQIDTCKGRKGSCKSSCKYSPWSDWGQCSRTCGGGTKMRTRDSPDGCGPSVDTKLCNAQACVPKGSSAGSGTPKTARGLRGE